MPAKDLGNKFICYKCSTKFYDLKKPEPLCPKCGADQRESPANRPTPEPRRSRLAAVPKPVVAPVAAAEEPAEEVAAEEEELESFPDEADPEVPEGEEEI